MTTRTKRIILLVLAVCGYAVPLCAMSAVMSLLDIIKEPIVAILVGASFWSCLGVLVWFAVDTINMESKPVKHKKKARKST